MERRRVTVEGTVQGVGFRPFVYRLAAELGAGGWVMNSPQGAVIEVEAPAAALDEFDHRLRHELPPHASICAFDSQPIPSQGIDGFCIRHSESQGVKSALILPDLAICPDCLREITDPTNRRYRYPFTNCTHCGPRYSIIRALPYDRPNTTMGGFVLCDDCQAEYENPLDRRFHAQPNACPKCGPQLALLDRGGRVLAARDDALQMAEQAIRDGGIVAVKGMGGFHLMVDARNSDAVTLLRARKARYEKPLAVMYPTIEAVERDCEVNELERALLTSAAAPIVLLRYRSGEIASQVAPDNPYMGVMLPYMPLQCMLVNDLCFPIVATSGNLSGEPICTENAEALEKLGEIACLFLVHNRPIARPVDDSVVRVAAGEVMTLRRARGYAPLPVDLPGAGEHTLIATGAQQKNTAALMHGEHVFLSQHLGDMDSAGALTLFKRALSDFQTLYDAQPAQIICDLHPDYATTHVAESSGLPVVRVQHHAAHVLSCMAEHHLTDPVLGVVWDGTGFGIDGTIWGGEFLRVDSDEITRVAHLRPFPLPGGDAASREPRRSLLGALYALYGDDLPRGRLDFTENELSVLLTALRKGLNTPQTSSMGRLFDAVAALAGLRQTCSFEGQAAMALEHAAIRLNTDECYPFTITPVTNDECTSGAMIEWKPVLTAMLDETDPAVISAKFHNTLARIVVEIASREGIRQLALTGGCFQNPVLLERTVTALRTAGFTPYWQKRIPPNDGGIALGQIAAALRKGHHVSCSSRQTDQYERRRT